MTTATELDSSRERLAQSFTSFETGAIHLHSRSLAGATHIVGTRKGLYAVNQREWGLIAPGFYFGVTVRGNDIYGFEACDQPHSPLRRGRVVRFALEGHQIVDTSVVAKGLDNGCHQIDFCGGQLHVVDTYNQQVVRLAPGEAGREVLSPLPTPPYGRWANTDRRYVHVNTILRVGDTNLLLLHNTSEHTGRLSELALYDAEWQPTARWSLQGRSCHGLALLEDGTLLTCDSMAGDIISAQGFRTHIASHFTRGLAVGADTVAVGGSFRASREQRMSSGGTVTFLDRDFREKAVLDVPGAPMEVRQLDGEDAGMSSYLERVPWGKHPESRNNCCLARQPPSLPPALLLGWRDSLHRPCPDCASA